MNVLVVSTYPPMACGIGRYAAQQVEKLRNEDHRVDVISPPEGEGEYQGVLLGGLRPMRLLRLAWAYDEIYLHYADQFYFDHARALNRILTSFAFVVLMAAVGRKFRVIIHESVYRTDGTGPRSTRRRVDRAWWQRVGGVIFHSARERDAFYRYYDLRPGLPPFEIWPQDKFIMPFCKMDREAARELLGVKPDETLLVCLGFIQPHKGFDRVINALWQIPEATNLRLKVVGSVRLAWDKAHAYARELHELAQRDARTEVIETWLNDELFDAWVLAADYVVLPYREIWSSAVAARARLYNRRLLAADIGALVEQLTPGSHIFRDDLELKEKLLLINNERTQSAASTATAAG